MKKVFWLTTILVFISIKLVFADVTAEIVSIDTDAKGAIRVWVQYKIDGIEVQGKYPKINEKAVSCSRYHVMNFAGMDDAEIKNRILADVTKHSDNLIRMTFIQKSNIDILTSHLAGVEGAKTTETEMSIYVDTDGDGIVDKEWIVKTDGTKIEKPYITP